MKKNLLKTLINSDEKKEIYDISIKEIKLKYKNTNLNHNNIKLFQKKISSKFNLFIKNLNKKTLKEKLDNKNKNNVVKIPVTVNKILKNIHLDDIFLFKNINEISNKEIKNNELESIFSKKINNKYKISLKKLSLLVKNLIKANKNLNINLIAKLITDSLKNLKIYDDCPKIKRRIYDIVNILLTTNITFNTGKYISFNKNIEDIDSKTTEHFNLKNKIYDKSKKNLLLKKLNKNLKYAIKKINKIKNRGNNIKSNVIFPISLKQLSENILD